MDYVCPLCEFVEFPEFFDKCSLESDLGYDLEREFLTISCLLNGKVGIHQMINEFDLMA
jgi:hypothetical protein